MLNILFYGVVALLTLLYTIWADTELPGKIILTLSVPLTVWAWVGWIGG